MNWYAAHAIMYVKFKDCQQDKYPMWENILLIEAQSDQDAMTKAIARAKEDEGDSEGTFTWEGRPATWCLGGIRKLVTCEFLATEPADGTEITYLELEVSSRQDFMRFLNGETVMIKYNGGEEPCPEDGAEAQAVRGRQGKQVSTNLTGIRQQIAEARERYRPTYIKCLLIAEAPPSDLCRFFYYPDVKEADYLFLGVMETLYPELKKEYIDKGRPRSLKENLLTKFQSDGFYLLDLFDVPVEQYTGTRKTAISDLVQRLRRVVTEQTPIILMKVTVYDTLAKRLKQAGFNVIEERIQFPAQAWQQDFQSHFVKALKKAALR